jgi:hypothetical protein
MPGSRIGFTGRPHWVAALTLLTLFLGTPGAFAQTAGPDEILNSGGAANQQLGLTEAQKTAIYNVVRRQPMRGAPGIPGTVPSAVGAQVSPAAELAALPYQAATIASVDDTPEKDLKYAMVEDDVVVVDPVKMRVVEVIHGNNRP